MCVNQILCWLVSVSTFQCRVYLFLCCCLVLQAARSHLLGQAQCAQQTDRLYSAGDRQRPRDTQLRAPSGTESEDAVAAVVLHPAPDSTQRTTLDHYSRQCRSMRAQAMPHTVPPSSTPQHTTAHHSGTEHCPVPIVCHFPSCTARSVCEREGASLAECCHNIRMKTKQTDRNATWNRVLTLKRL